MPDPSRRAEIDTSPGGGLTPEELRAEQSQPLPDREALSTLNTSFGFPIDNFAMPINEAISANINTNYSVASADADQVVIVDQASTGESK